MSTRKSQTIFICSACGAKSPRWEGRCRECGSWNTFTEERVHAAPKSALPSRDHKGLVPLSEARPLREAGAAPGSSSFSERESSGFTEVDRVLGGGFVTGSILLFGGEPGIGKSTLLLQIIGSLCKKYKVCLYVSGEESAAQVESRARRLGLELGNELVFLATSSLEEAVAAVEKCRPYLVVVDSVQTLSTGTLENSAGTVSQVREVTQSFLNLAKGSGVVTLLVGHVTKEGQIAGPRLLEHMVDGVFYFELAASGGYRLLRGQKNRFGATHELAVLEMSSAGMVQVANPSVRFLAERSSGLAGSAVVAHLEGSRPFLTEVQALTQRCYQGYPRRTVQGVDQNRISVLLAIIEKRLEISMSDHDVYCKVASGARIEEPAADLPLLFALASAQTGKAIPSDMILMGEVGLGGEIRSINGLVARLNEAKSVGLSRAVIPSSCERDAKEIKGMKISGVRNITEVMQIIQNG